MNYKELEEILEKRHLTEYPLEDVVKDIIEQMGSDFPAAAAFQSMQSLSCISMSAREALAHTTAIILYDLYMKEKAKNDEEEYTHDRIGGEE